MTLYLIDIAKYQAGLDLTRVEAEGFSGVLARASTGYRPSSSSPAGGSADPQYATFARQAKQQTRLLFGAYHFLYPHSRVSIAHQAAVCAAAVGDKGIPVMVDHEPDGSNAPTPSVQDAVDFARAMRAKGYRVPLWYLPHWVWQGKLGSPSLPDSGMQLVSSNYPLGAGTSGYASSLYGRVGDAGWAGYGGQRPVIWQFTDAAKVAGKLVDADAYEGSLADLTALFHGEDTPVPDDTADKRSTNRTTRAVWGQQYIPTGNPANSYETAATSLARLRDGLDAANAKLDEQAAVLAAIRSKLGA